MIRFRTLLCAASAACGITLGFGAHAQTITTITLPSGGCVVSGSTLDCSGGAVTPPPSTPTCKLTASATSATVGDNVTFSVGSCANTSGALTYAWNINSQGSSACTNGGGNATCVITSTAPATFSVAVNVTDTNGAVSVTGSPKSIAFNAVSSGGDGATIPASCSDGTKTVKLSTVNAFDGFQVGLDNFGSGQVGYWIVNVPPMPANTQIAFSVYQYGNPANMNYYMSKTDVCSTATQVLKGVTTGSIYGGVNDGQTGFTTSVMAPLPKVHMQSGETWYVMVRPARSTSCKSTLCSPYLKPQIQN
jgi:hypothetical protein